MARSPRSLTAVLALQEKFLKDLPVWQVHQQNDGGWEREETPHGSEYRWVIYAQHSMLRAVNRVRRERGVEPAKLEEVVRIDNVSAGHVDYAHKLTLRLAELALQDGVPTLPLYREEVTP